MAAENKLFKNGTDTQKEESTRAQAKSGTRMQTEANGHTGGLCREGGRPGKKSSRGADARVRAARARGEAACEVRAVSRRGGSRTLDAALRLADGAAN